MKQPLTTIPEGAPGHDEAELSAAAGLAAYLVTTVLLVLPLLVHRSGRRLGGAVTVVVGGVAALSAVIGGSPSAWASVLAVIIAGAALEMALRPNAAWGRLTEPARSVVFAASVPAALWPAQLVAVSVVDTVRWPVELWSGVVVLTALAAGALGLLAAPLTAAAKPAPGRRRSCDRVGGARSAIPTPHSRRRRSRRCASGPDAASLNGTPVTVADRSIRVDVVTVCRPRRLTGTVAFPRARRTRRWPHMSTGRASTFSLSTPFAASVTVLAAVGYDVAAGQHLSQVLLLGGLATVVAVLRVLLHGRYRGLFSALSGAVVTLPALHLAGTVAAPLTTDVPLDFAHLLGNDLPLTAGQLLAAGVLVSVVMSSERAFLLAATALGGVLCVVVPRAPRTFTGAPVPLPAVPPLHDPLCRRHVDRRGPPAERVLVLS